MTNQEIKDYRKILEKDFTDKDLEVETSLSYISIGALGFFMTINEKFVILVSADYKTILISSLIFLFLAVALVLIRKSRTSHNDLKMMHLLDEIKPDTNEDLQLLELWERSHKELNWMIILSYCCLGIGTGLQVLFLLLNLK